MISLNSLFNLNPVTTFLNISLKTLLILQKPLLGLSMEVKLKLSTSKS
jgi:hypothetical protein